MKILTKEAVNIRPFIIKRREPQSRDDFGDNDTIGLHLRRKPFKTIEEANLLKDFGIFYGWFNYGFLVGVKDEIFKCGTFELYDTLEELKAVWELD